MKRSSTDPRLARESMIQGIALASLLAMGALVLVGPSGLLAWSDNRQLLELREAEIARLTTARDEMKNRVALLNPRNADPDLAGELLRRELNVVHPDEMVMLLR